MAMNMFAGMESNEKSYSPLEIQTIKDKVWNITEELYNDELNGFQQVFRGFNDYLTHVNSSNIDGIKVLDIWQP